MTPKNEHRSSLDIGLVFVGKFEKERLSSCDVGRMKPLIKKKKIEVSVNLQAGGNWDFVCVELHAANAVRRAKNAKVLPTF